MYCYLSLTIIFYDLIKSLLTNNERTRTEMRTTSPLQPGPPSLSCSPLCSVPDGSWLLLMIMLMMVEISKSRTRTKIRLGLRWRDGPHCTDWTLSPILLVFKVEETYSKYHHSRVERFILRCERDGKLR